MRTRVRSPRLPRALLRGMKLRDGVTGEDIFMNDYTTRKQRGLWMHKDNFDELTTAQMDQQLMGAMR